MNVEASEIKYRREINFKPALSCLTACRRGEVLGNGHNLLVHSEIFIENGGSWDELGTKPEEVKAFLVEDLKAIVQQLREDKEEWDQAVDDFIILSSYYIGGEFMGEERGNPSHPVLYEELGTTLEEMKSLLHRYDVRLCREEFERCRSGLGPTELFYGANQNFTEGKVSLKEAGVIQEELATYIAAYLEKYPYSELK